VLDLGSASFGDILAVYANLYQSRLKGNDHNLDHFLSISNVNSANGWKGTGGVLRSRYSQKEFSFMSSSVIVGIMTQDLNTADVSDIPVPMSPSTWKVAEQDGRTLNFSDPTERSPNPYGMGIKVDFYSIQNNKRNDGFGSHMAFKSGQAFKTAYSYIKRSFK
jgi:hypothetical protein